MNRIPARIDTVLLHEGVSLLQCDACGERLTMVALELPEGVKPGAEVVLGIKATHVGIATTTLPDAAISNQLPVTIESIETGVVLSALRLRFCDTTLESILPQSALQKLALKAGDTAVALFQASELSIVEIPA